MRKYSTIVVLVLTFVLSSCHQYTYETIFPTLSDGKYDTEFPYKTCSKQIGEIAKSVKKLHCIAEYKTYFLPFEEAITKDLITKSLLRKKASSKQFDSESVIGTATIIFYDQEKIALMTSAHVINHPDTVIGYYEGVEKEGQKIIHTISIKTRQLNYIRDIPVSKNLKILAKDDNLDIAILGQDVDADKRKEVNVFSYPMGDSDELEWGSFVYIMGYPSGYQMITRGIVSTPGGKHKKNFLIDALFNKGISGGIVLAIKDGVPNFELVGMAKSVAANYENILIPEEDSHLKQYNPNSPYTGNIFVKVKKEINYGITYSVSSNSIRKFLDDHKIELAEEGYLFNRFLKQEKK